MTRPAHVRCENCVWWERADYKDAHMGTCYGVPREVARMYTYSDTDCKMSAETEWCGLFRSEWPKEGGGCCAG